MRVFPWNGLHQEVVLFCKVGAIACTHAYKKDYCDICAKFCPVPQSIFVDIVFLRVINKSGKQCKQRSTFGWGVPQSFARSQMIMPIDFVWYQC